jgi:outer membrane protein assembly factor BamB
MTSRLILHRSGVLVALTAGLLFWTGLAGPVARQARQPAPAAADAEALVKDLVVMIRGKLGGEDAIGAGIIFAIDQDRLYIATANHVVRQGLQTAITGMEVLFKWLPGEWKAANLLADFDTEADLAVINVPGARSLIGARKLSFDRLAPEVKRLDQVFTVGYPAGQAWYPRVTPDIVAEVTGETVAFETSYLERGNSGGALVNARWEIVGLVREDRPPRGVALRLDRVIERLTQWGYRPGLTAPRPLPDSTSRGGPPPDPGRGVADPPSGVLKLLNAAGWPMFGRDEVHTGWNRDETSLQPPLRLVKEIRVPNRIVDSLSAAEGRLFAGGMNENNANEIVGIDVASGRMEWTFTLAGGGAMNVVPAYSGGRVFVGGQRDDHVYALNHLTGKAIWTSAGVGNLYSRHPLVRAESVYCVADDALVALDAQTGKLQWRYPLESMQTSPIAIGSLLVVLGRATKSRSRDTAVLHVVGYDGTGIRSFQVPSALIQRPVAWLQPPSQGGRPTWLIGITSGREVSAFLLTGGTAVWTTQLPGDQTSEPQMAYANGLVIVRLWRSIPSGNGFLYALDAARGAIAWRFSPMTEGLFGPVIANGVVYVAGTKTRRLFALDHKDGRELWNAYLPTVPTANPIVAYGYLFVPAGNTIYVFGT